MVVVQNSARRAGGDIRLKQKAHPVVLDAREQFAVGKRPGAAFAEQIIAVRVQLPGMPERGDIGGAAVNIAAAIKNNRLAAVQREQVRRHHACRARADNQGILRRVRAFGKLIQPMRFIRRGRGDGVLRLRRGVRDSHAQRVQQPNIRLAPGVEAAAQNRVFPHVLLRHAALPRNPWTQMPIRISVAALRQFLRRNVKMREKIFRHSSPPRTQNMPLKTADCVLRASAVKKFQN